MCGCNTKWTKNLNKSTCLVDAQNLIQCCLASVFLRKPVCQKDKADGYNIKQERLFFKENKAFGF